MLEEHEIDLIDLVMEVLKHWKGAIVCMLIGATCLGIFGHMRGTATNMNSSAAEMTYAQKKAVDVALEYEKTLIKAEKSNDADIILRANSMIISSVLGFKDVQLKYFTENSQKDIWKADGYEFAVSQPSGQPPVDSSGMSLKFMLLGAIAFCVVYLCAWALVYILDGHIKSSDDMRTLINIPQIGRIYTITKPRFIIDKCIYILKHHGQRIFETDKSVELIASNLSVMAKRKNIDAITIVGCNLEKKARKYCDEIVDILNSSYHIYANVLNDIVYDQASVESLAESKSIVLIETVGNTLYADLDKEIKLVNQLSIDVLGGVIVE